MKRFINILAIPFTCAVFTMKKIIIVVSTCILMVMAVQAEADIYGGIEFPDGAASFADEVVSYTPGSHVMPPYMNPENALGVPEETGVFSDNNVSLGNYGVLVIEFTDNRLTTSGNSDIDLWVFESGSGTENIDVFISENGNDWVEVGRVTAGTVGIDIDDYIGFGIVDGGLYSYVRLVDVGNNYYTGPYAGADINAVGAITTRGTVRIVGKPGYYSSLQAAYDDAVNSNIIQSFDTVFYEDVVIDSVDGKLVSFEYGYNNDFSSIIGKTTIYGNMIISTGITTIQDGVLEIM